MAVTAYHIPAQASNVKQHGGTIAWSFNFGTNAWGATFFAAGQQTDWLVFSDFQLAADLPAGATVTGVEFSLTRSDPDLGSRDDTIQLRLLGSFVGDDKATATSWPSSAGTVTYGGATDLWGTTWTTAQLHDTSFGIGVAAVTPADTSSTPRIHFGPGVEARIRVYYTDTVTLTPNIAETQLSTVSPTLGITGTISLSPSIAEVQLATTDTAISITGGTATLVPTAFATVELSTISPTLSFADGGGTGGSRLMFVDGVLEVIDEFSPKYKLMKRPYYYRRWR